MPGDRVKSLGRSRYATSIDLSALSPDGLGKRGDAIDARVILLRPSV
jgi:hypothetical protein